MNADLRFLCDPRAFDDDIFDDVNQRTDEAWDAIWDSAGQITESGYLVEM